MYDMAEKITNLNTHLSQLKVERDSWESHWQDLGDFFSPRSVRFLSSDVNKGTKKFDKIINNTATKSLRTLSSGMMAGLTSPARPWFRLVTDPKFMENATVKTWLFDVQTKMMEVFSRSNVYQVLPTTYRNLGLYGTACQLLLEDEDDIIRLYSLPTGTYYIANNAKGKVDVVFREFRMTVRQMVAEYGYDNCSSVVRAMKDGNNCEQWIDLVQVIQPNCDRDPYKIDNKNKKYVSLTYEFGNNEGQFLRMSGYDEFPAQCPRWDNIGEDVYGESPGMVALGDVKGLQLIEKRGYQAADKIVNPPMIADAMLQNRRTSLLPGDVTYISGLSTAAGAPYRAAIEVNPAAMQVMELKAREVETRIRSAMYEDLMLMLATGDNSQMTAREVEERHQEKLLVLGPVMERLGDELLDPMIDRTFEIMLRKGMLPEPPKVIQGQELSIEYISIMAQAQKLIGTAAIERLYGFAGNLSAVRPDVMDKLDIDQTIDEYAAMVGTPPRIVKGDEEVAQIRSAREQQMQMQQAAQMAQPLQQTAQAAKVLSETGMDDPSALTRLLGA